MPPAQPQHEHRARAHEELDARVEAAEHADELRGCARTYSWLAASKRASSCALLGVGAHHPRPREVLLDERVDVRELRLHRLEAVVDAAAEVAHQEGDEEAAAPGPEPSSSGLMRGMRTMVPTKVASVLAVYMIPGPSTMRTAERSLVARLMRSPMRWRW